MGTVHDIDQQRRADLIQTVLGVLDDWHVEPSDQAQLLGLPEGTGRRALQHYRQGKALQDEERVMIRCSRLLTIQNAVRTMHPQSVDMANYWPTTANPFFNDRSPVQMMLEHDLDGMDRIVRHLNGHGEW